ncbi:MAG: DUF6766 family protein [Acidimicrobiales bacterium]
MPEQQSSPSSTRTKRFFVRDNSLTIMAMGIFVVFLVGQSLVGHATYNADQREHGDPTVGYVSYLGTGHFGETVFENWESEFLQMGAYVLLTVWLRQRGSPESKSLTDPEAVDEAPEGHARDPGVPGPVRRGGLALWLYRNSLSTAFLVLFVLSWLAHGVTGAAEFNEEQLAHGQGQVSVVGYMSGAQFWNESLQNWQSEFLAVGSLVILSVYLRQQGSPESKPVHATNDEQG